MTILRPESVGRKNQIYPTRWTLLAATRESVNRMGETMAHFRIGNAAFRHRALVADIGPDAILGMDIMTKFDFKLDLQAGTLKVKDEEVILNYNQEVFACVVLAEDVIMASHSEAIVEASLDAVPKGGRF